MVSAALIAIAGILSFISIRTTYYIIKVLSAVAWLGLFAWWIANPFTTAGSPAHVIVLMLLLFISIAFMFFPFWEAKFKNGSESGGKWRLPFQATEEEEELSAQQRKLPTHQQRVDAYYARIEARLRGERRQR